MIELILVILAIILILMWWVMWLNKLVRNQEKIINSLIKWRNETDEWGDTVNNFIADVHITQAADAIGFYEDK